MSIEAMKQALEAWQTSVYGSESHHKAMLLAMTNMAQAIEQAETAQGQEPVAWMVYTLDGKSVCVTDNPTDFTDGHRALPLYTASRQWVGLTAKDLAEIPSSAYEGAIWADAKLKEKNT